MDKEKQLAQLEKEIAAAALPLSGESNLVFGEGNPDADVLFIGEAPGLNEDMQKRPFVGRAGQLLNKMLEEMGWKREDTYITNIVKRRPPDNRDPLPAEIEAYLPYLIRQIDIISPRVIVTLGRVSMSYFLPKAKITADHGRVFEKNGRLVFPLFHPAAALRNPAVLEQFRSDLHNLPKVLAGDPAFSPVPVADTSPPNAPPPQSTLF